MKLNRREFVKAVLATAWPAMLVFGGESEPKTNNPADPDPGPPKASPSDDLGARLAASGFWKTPIRTRVEERPNREGGGTSTWTTYMVEWEDDISLNARRLRQGHDAF